MEIVYVKHKLNVFYYYFEMSERVIYYTQGLEGVGFIDFPEKILAIRPFLGGG